MQRTTWGAGMAVKEAALVKPVPPAHRTIQSRPSMWETSPFPVRSQTCPRTPSSSFLDGPRYVTQSKVFEFKPQKSGVKCLRKNQKELLIRCHVAVWGVEGFLCSRTPSLGVGPQQVFRDSKAGLEVASSTPFSLTDNFLS